MYRNNKKGMTLVEVVVSVAIFLFISLSVYQAYSGLLALVSLSRVKITAANLASEQFEIIKNLPYSSVGTVSGVPSGVVPQSQNLVRDGKTFTVKTTVRNIDDPFDGTLGGIPNDTSPADYKLVELEVLCENCNNFTPIILSAQVSPRSLESTSSNGNLFITVFDASGIPVQGATVRVINIDATIDITDVTDASGMLKIVDTPPGNENYQIQVSKSGYSSDRTYASGDVSNPNPTKPHATVAAQTVTEISFSIDRLSTIEVSTVRNTCALVGNVDFSIDGAKLIGSSPDVKKYSSSFETNASGVRTISNLEWDTYNIDMTDASYFMAGTISPLPIALSPNSTQNASIVVADVVPNALLVSVKDNASMLPLSGANVTLELGGTEETLITGRGHLRQTNWSGGPGEENASGNTNEYWADDGYIEANSPQGVIKLENLFGTHALSGNLESSTFDTGSAATFYEISWAPESQPALAGPDSVKLQIATSNDEDGPWSYTGHDGTSGTYYTTGNKNIHSTNNGKRYIRYKIFLETDDQYTTPTVSDVYFTFSSACAPPGQVLFTNLSPSNSYNISVKKSGYQDYLQPISIGASWQATDVPMLTE